jgi:hypothetical protein
LNVNFEAMREEIEKILEDFNSMEIEPNEAIDKLLNLHIVSQQRELLESFREKWNESRFVSDGIYESDIDDFLEELNESNCG